MADDGWVDIGLLGHIGPYYPYDQNDPKRPQPKERPFPFGFAAPQNAGKRRSPKRRAPRKR